MFAITRSARLARIHPHVSARSLATLQGDSPALQKTNERDANPSLDISAEHRIAVHPNHGLWHFFRKKKVDGTVRYDTVEPPDVKITGRSWTAPELRRKNFSDLHTLWYVVLRERNLLATQKEEARRLGVTNPRIYTSLSKLFQCRKTMARIKYVLNERRLAYEGAVNIVTEQRAEAKAKAAADVSESHEAKKERERALALQKLRRAAAYRRHIRVEATPRTRRIPAEQPAAASVAASLFPSDP